jgi:hypothetical protein
MVDDRSALSQRILKRLQQVDRQPKRLCAYRLPNFRHRARASRERRGEEAVPAKRSEVDAVNLVKLSRQWRVVEQDGDDSLAGVQRVVELPPNLSRRGGVFAPEDEHLRRRVDFPGYLCEPGLARLEILVPEDGVGNGRMSNERPQGQDQATDELAIHSGVGDDERGHRAIVSLNRPWAGRTAVNEDRADAKRTETC